ncbi:hypothetical protein GGD57_002827 [Rhizobium esperanzae]|uniref:Uncharacterized protein n=1 Tax=Rhizobium esperanzae TaxID=1967781 RepID=A0A7W6W558_9HYPH|nr:hypothetical protein [Rhizobium esperanzae]
MISCIRGPRLSGENLQCEIHDPRPGDCRTDDQRAADDDDDVIGKTGKGGLGRHDADDDCHEKGTDGDDIVSITPPYEGAHHERDDEKRKPLINAHVCIPVVAINV